MGVGVFGGLLEEAFDRFGWEEPPFVVPGDPENYLTATREMDGGVGFGTGDRRGTGTHMLRAPEAHEVQEQQDLDAAQRHGLDQLAWYVSHHFGSDWGIYIREAGAVALGRELADRNHSDPWMAGLDILYLHELLHAAVDAAITTVELVVRAPLYVPRLRALNMSLPPWDPVEEGLSNAHAFRVQTSRASRNDAVAVASTLAQGPDGYRAFARYQSKGRRRAAYEDLMSSYLTPRRHAWLPGSAWLLEGALGDRSDVPVYLVRDYPGPPVFGFIQQVSTVREDGQFKKSLRKLPKRVQGAWSKALEQLSESTQHPGLQFKPLKGRPGYFSVRVGDGYRAILYWSESGWDAVRLEPRRSVYR